MSIVLDNSKDDEKNENEAKNSESEEEKDEQGIIQEVHMKPEGAELFVGSNVISNNILNVIQGAVDPRVGVPRAGNFLTPLLNLQVFPGIINLCMYRKSTYPTPPKTSFKFLTSSPWE